MNHLLTYKINRRLFLYLLKFVMGKIFLNSIRLYAFHGCMDEESLIGSDYIVNIEVDTNLTLSSNSDDLSDTVDYVTLHDIVKREMKKRAYLLENVTHRIGTSILEEHLSVETVKVKVVKKNPPIGGNVDEVAVQLELKR